MEEISENCYLSCSKTMCSKSSFINPDDIIGVRKVCQMSGPFSPCVRLSESINYQLIITPGNTNTTLIQCLPRLSVPSILTMLTLYWERWKLNMLLCQPDQTTNNTVKNPPKKLNKIFFRQSSKFRRLLTWLMGGSVLTWQMYVPLSSSLTEVMWR